MDNSRGEETGGTFSAHTFTSETWTASCRMLVLPQEGLPAQAPTDVLVPHQAT